MPINNKPAIAKIICFSDSHGGALASELRKNSGYKVYDVVKPEAKFDIVT